MFAQAGTRRAGGDIEQLAAAVTLVAVLIADLATLSSAVPDPLDSQVRKSISDGQTIAPNEFPFLASIWEGGKEGPKHRCTGSIVGPKHIVTSAKCIDRTANELTAKLGCTHPTRCKQEIDIVRVLLHPYFYLSRIRQRDQYDLALLLTNELIEMSQEDGISPIDTDINKMDARCKRRFMLVGFANYEGPKAAMLKYRAAIAPENVCEGIKNVGKGTICVHSTGGFLPEQFIGSAFVARPVDEKGPCAGQMSHLVGLVSAIGRNITSIVTDLNTTQTELWRIGGL